MNYRIAKLPGDGIGPEIVEEAVRILNAIGNKFGHQFNFEFGYVGAAAIDATGNPFPDETLQTCMNSDAVLFGSIGDPKYDNDPKAKIRPEQGLLAMRQALGLYANIRPVTAFESLIDQSPLKSELISGVDFVVVRELTGGIYFGEPRGRSERGDKAFDTCVYTKAEIERILELALDYAAKRRKKLTVVDKANVLATSRLWRETAQEMEPNHPNIEVDYMFVDNAAMQLIQWPKKLDVMVTENMFGDILSDEASVISGSLGLLPSASVGIHTSVYEPVHGSYPQAAGKNIANPIATILSAAMMLETSLDLTEEAEIIRSSVNACLSENVVTEDISTENAFSTSEVGDFIAQKITEAALAM